MQRTDSKVIDIALKYGYSSPTSFNRAFQNIHGIMPTAAKSMGSTLQAYPSIQFSITITKGGFVTDTSCTDLQRYGLQSVRRISKRCII